MKKILLISIALFLFAACSLDETPSSISREGLALTKEGAEQLVTGVYDVFWSSYMMNASYTTWIDIDNDHSTAATWIMSGPGEGNPTTHWAYNDANQDLFNVFYRMINRANAAAEALGAAGKETNPKIGQRYGEVLFLRAFAYFHLVRMYGPVPLRLTSIGETDCPRSSVADVYGQITTDLLEAIQFLQYPSSGNVGAWGHADRTAARLLLARVYCTMGSGKLASSGAQMYVKVLNPVTSTSGQPELQSFTCDPVAGYEQIDAVDAYENAKLQCDSVIARRGIDFDMMPNYNSIWGAPNYRNKEFVWGVAGYDLPQFIYQARYDYTPTPYGGYNWNQMSDGLYYSFEPEDLRRVDGVFHYWKPQGNYNSTDEWYRFPEKDDRYATAPDGSQAKDISVVNPDGWYRAMAYTNKKYFGDITKPEVLADEIDNKSGNPQDAIFLRFAEAYLLRAEACNELGDPASALSDLRVIRSRVNASMITTSDQTMLRSSILEERALELCFEFNRKFDLFRWGLYLKVMNATQAATNATKDLNAKAREPRSILYPVPTTETRENRLFGPNNKGW